jgi:hypothetical protein
MTLIRSALAAALFAVAVPAAGHHSFDAEFDRNKVVNLRGTVTKMEWVNPHAMIHIAVKDEDGSTSHWMIEGNTPNSLLRAGLTKNSLQAGTEILVKGYRARSGENFISGSAILFKSGKSLTFGTEGDAAPIFDWISADEQLWKLQLEAWNRNQ